MGPLKPDVAELVVATVCFALVFVIVGRVLLPRITRVLDERHELTEGRLDAADGIKEEIAGVAKDLQRELAEGRREAARVRQELIDEGAETISSLRAEGQRAREELIASNTRSIAEERAVAEAVLHAELGLIATELAGKVLGESVTDFVASGDTVERFLAEVQAHVEEQPTP
ncbi:F0F1 ATP synthase subunit B family protein [Yinghuangia sp. YIM S10712]|uniref:F0F1 ATP synthase subunit B family protein n=1 Tax=Yinghuangia sp. YIM S10712 TaxID=3436930 RepID=UPI003F532174